MIKIISKGKHRFWHRMILVKDNGFTKYISCTSCETRQIIQPDFGYQPINWDWLNFETNEI